jgi:hypothetical protein
MYRCSLRSHFWCDLRPQSSISSSGKWGGVGVGWGNICMAHSITMTTRWNVKCFLWNEEDLQFLVSAVSCPPPLVSRLEEAPRNPRERAVCTRDCQQLKCLIPRKVARDSGPVESGCQFLIALGTEGMGLLPSLRPNGREVILFNEKSS